MPLQIDPQACELMKDQVRKTNGQFYNPRNITTKEILENASTIKDAKSFNGMPVKPLSRKEYEKMRHEEHCFVHFYNGKYNAHCRPIKNMEGALAGGKLDRFLNIPSNYPKKVYYFHNHPLFRESFPSGVDIASHFSSLVDHPPNKIKDVYGCVGEMDYQGNHHIVCYNFKEPYLKKARYFNTEINKMEKQLDDQITRGEITEKEAVKIATDSPLYKSLYKFKTNLSENLDERWHKYFDSIQRDDFGYLIQGKKNKDGSHTYSYYHIPSQKQRKNLIDGFKQEFSDILEFGEC